MYICKDLTSEGIASSALSFISIADHSHTNRLAFLFFFLPFSLVPKSWIKVTWLVVSICLEYQSLSALPFFSFLFFFFFLLTTARLKKDSQWFNEMHERRGEQEKGLSQMAEQTVLCVSDKNRSTDVSWRNMNWNPQLCQLKRKGKKGKTSWDYGIENTNRVNSRIFGVLH